LGNRRFLRVGQRTRLDPRIGVLLPETLQRQIDRALERLIVSYAHLYPCFDNGSERMRVPVAEKIALQTAGMIGGSAGSPSPVGALFVAMNCTSISGGACAMRTGGNWLKLLCTTRPRSMVISQPIRWLKPSITDPCT